MRIVRIVEMSDGTYEVQMRRQVFKSWSLESWYGWEKDIETVEEAERHMQRVLALYRKDKRTVVRVVRSEVV